MDIAVEGCIDTINGKARTDTSMTERQLPIRSGAC
jgi:hypothetical protein